MTGSGTQADPYKIYNVTDLQAMTDDLTAYYELANDIDASATTGWSDAEGTGFIPLGQPSGGDFTGHFDGKGYTISNLFMKRTYREVGLFDQTNGGTIQNVTLSGVDFTADSDGGGALVGYRVRGNATITNCHASGTITADGVRVGGLFGYVYSATITNCSSSCDIINDDDYVGGLVGYIDNSTVSGCFATGNVTTPIGVANHTMYIGGFAGYAAGGTIDQCYATGDVAGYGDVGGFAGYASNDSITNCYARGNVTGTVYGVGGFVGGCYTGTIVDNCYSTGIPTGGEYNGGFKGYGGGTTTNCFWDTETSGTEISDGGTGKTTAQMKTESTFTDAGWDFTTPIWYINPTINDGYPAFTGVVRRIKGNPNIDQRMFQHVERIDR